MASMISADIGSGNGVWPDGTKPSFLTNADLLSVWSYARNSMKSESKYIYLSEFENVDYFVRSLTCWDNSSVAQQRDIY